ncbi:MAG: hypothetical protein JWM59_2253 [Verrucomicrobiales bacterium]|nr:hypothetical protein [Verrucomicrobiales bacterium]
MRRFFSLFFPAVCLLTAFSPPAGAEEQAPDSGFAPLFNGRDLTGWVNVNGSPETWTVADGLIHCDGQPVCALRTVKQYENFVLEAEWRHLKSGGNAGIFIWASALPAPGQPFLRAIEVQVLDNGYGTSDWYTTHGDVFAIHGSTMKPFPPSKGMRSFPTENRSKGTPEWNHYRITSQDGTIRLAVNGKDVSGGEDCVWRKGYIGLESEGSPVDWRNVRIKLLPGGKATDEQTAPLAEDSRKLYDGRSLRGWKAGGAADKNWKPEDWTLISPGAEAALNLEQPLAGDGTLIFDVCGPEEQIGQFKLEFKGGNTTAGISYGAPAGWQRITLVRKKGKITATRAGEMFGEVTAPDEAMTVSFSSPYEGTKFGNLFWTPK